MKRRNFLSLAVLAGSGKLLLPDSAFASPHKLNPGNGSVSRICHEPKVTVAVLTEMLSPYMSNGQLVILTGYKPRKADASGDNLHAVQLYNKEEDHTLTLPAPTKGTSP